MANAFIGFGNRLDDAVVQDGSWEPTLPLTNLQTRKLGRVARTTDLALASTQLTMDLTTLERIRAVALVNHNGSLDCQVRVTFSETADFAVLTEDTGWLDIWPAVYATEDLDFEAENWWSGQYLLREIGAVTPTFPIILDAAIWARFVRIEVSDTGNLAGYFQMGRVFVGDGWQPRCNMISGSGVGVTTDTTFEKALSGAMDFNRTASRRYAAFTIAQMYDSEAMASAYELMMQMGIDGEVLFVWDPDDTVHALRRRFLGHLSELGQITYPYFDAGTTALRVEELL